jgi:hypothetical protein
MKVCQLAFEALQESCDSIYNDTWKVMSSSIKILLMSFFNERGDIQRIGQFRNFIHLYPLSIP